MPEGGAARLPDLLAAALPPGTVRTGVRVRTVATNLVTTEGHGDFSCRSVVLATGARAAADLLPGLRVPNFHEVTVIHHATAARCRGTVPCSSTPTRGGRSPTPP